MIDPFGLLGVAESADDGEIKAAYLRKVREYPPEQSPEQFQSIRDAYEQIRTEKARLSYRLFPAADIDRTALFSQLAEYRKPQRPTVSQFKQMLAATISEGAMLATDEKE